MLAAKRWTLVLPLAMVAAVLTSCDRESPTAATISDVPPPSADAALTGRVPFTISDITLQASAACLGLTDPLDITGTVSGWDQITELTDGRVHVTEYLDFTALSASDGERSWTAGPGAHEIWSENLGWEGDAAENIIHEGRSPFLGAGDAPNFILVHRIHEVLTPNLVLTVANITPLTVECIQ
ncbi:MAG: hypothetical protein LJF06_00950 [Gemmatimonadetes bacterium]|nr:hypothetical protein [Gemmatimonadota bacterium]